MNKTASDTQSISKEIHSEINGTLKITWIHGKKVLNSETANYSYGSLQRVLDYALSNIYFDSKANILLLGMGGGSVIDTLINRYNHRGSITAVEIDPVVIELAEKEFDIKENKDLIIISEDAMDYVANCQKTYDLIIIDLFIDLKVPSKFYKILFWDQLIKLIKPKGNVLFNAGVNLKERSKIDSIQNHYQDEIGFIQYDNVQGTNTIVIGHKT
ncbi:spermidine synthase [uncultured Aquimarina sp.]|uniref:spermidine synthase n=1 Tax=uncultured Aquimarina sp. TaxID=575652 RepID=UPI00261134A3|nr:fused MFS/spermidine synthase [uncultured Aquimarina sp.]